MLGAYRQSLGFKWELPMLLLGRPEAVGQVRAWPEGGHPELT